MITICNRLIPFGGYQAMAFWPFVFTRSSLMSARRKNHESIHLRQQFEVMVVAAFVMTVLCFTILSWWWMFAFPFVYYLLYCTEYVVRIAVHGKEEAYCNISFEQEAIMNEKDFYYLKNRKRFAWVKYIGKKTYRK